MSREQQENGAETGEKEIASRAVQIESKRFYLDVKQNRRGRFLKIAEVGASGQKSRVLMSMSSTCELRDKLTEFVEFQQQAKSAGANGDQVGGNLKSEIIVKDNRRYFLDLKENQRGRYLRIVQQVSPSGIRNQVAMPDEGIEELRDKLAELIDECGTDDMADGVEQLPEPKSLRADSKMFYFDVGVNRRGKFLRLSEVRANFRTAVTVPENSWAALRDIIDEFIGEAKETEQQQ